MNIPNSFSTEDLTNALKKAPKEADVRQSSEEYKSKVIELAEKHLAAAFDELQDPVLHKAMAVIILQNLITYHEKRSVGALGEDAPQVAGLWARDSGRLLAALQVLQTTSVSNEDFMAAD